MEVCDKCGQEIETAECFEWVEIPALGIEVTKDVLFKGARLSEVVTPKGCRLLTITEAMFLANNDKYSKILNIFSGHDDFFIEQPFKRNKEKGYVAALYSGYGGGRLGVDGGILGGGSYGCAFGVRFARQIKGD